MNWFDEPEPLDPDAEATLKRTGHWSMYQHEMMRQQIKRQGGDPDSLVPSWEQDADSEIEKIWGRTG